jgi:hypothetical protein
VPIDFGFPFGSTAVKVTAAPFASPGKGSLFIQNRVSIVTPPIIRDSSIKIRSNSPALIARYIIHSEKRGKIRDWINPH